MSLLPPHATCGEALVHLLAAYGIDTVFGIPGVHTVSLYRGLPQTAIRHITPRHEQGAGFMADGYARVSGKPGVCFIITGPGMTNILTAMGQAYADSVPMLVISSVNKTHQLGLGEGRLHELKNQSEMVAGVAAFSHTLMRPQDLPKVLARAFSVFNSSRPRPVHIEIPIDIIDAPFGEPSVRAAALPDKPCAPEEALAQAGAWMRHAVRPLLLLGGGCARADPARVQALAEAWDAPVCCTINAKGLLPNGHPLQLGSNQSLPAVRELAAQADVVLAIGTELGETDYDVVFDGNFQLGGRLIRIDIDAEQLQRNHLADLAIVGDAADAVSRLADMMAAAPISRQGAQRAAAVREALAAYWPPAWLKQAAVLAQVQQTLPGVIVVGDSTQPVYSGNHLYEPDTPRAWFNASTGYGTLGYALPAASGAKLAAPHRPVVCLIGDGGIQFTLPELASAVEAGIGIVVLLWNNHGYGEIKRYMRREGLPEIGVDIYTPDFQTLARGFGCQSARVSNLAELGAALRQAAPNRPTLIEIVEDDFDADR
ncbi:5-guanidino-2-oxopentanoate decarboxylase [Neisseria shayeganii]|uniref:5-guanidino-2-oxopentanoate decarboxylase n=1 Tax=Neisseria shayeganii TaxID=607712 RepID=A0A7D7SI27_9NEIS|nr:5-guanidino-2-oxopentanoate decarboxylase [Neisseria shayeganii]QMT40427.1 5-guanidino-2-oxopentanoate decarboxylase [Neisseria shayeganii]